MPNKNNKTKRSQSKAQQKVKQQQQVKKEVNKIAQRVETQLRNATTRMEQKRGTTKLSAQIIEPRQIQNKQGKIGNKQALKAQRPLDCYAKQVLSPFNSDPVRGPSDFFQPTCLLKYKYEQDISFGNTFGTINVLPHCYNQQDQPHGWAWVNTSVRPQGQAFNWAASDDPNPAGGPIQNSVFVHPLAGGDFSYNNPTNYFSSNPSVTTGARWVSARTLALGIKIIPSANITVKQGTLTCGIIPGKTFIAGTSTMTIPTVSQLRQYPTSYEIQLAGVGAEGTDLIWIPLDPLDFIYMEQFSMDYDSVDCYYRNPMWCLFSGINTSDTYRVEVTTVVEYVPVLNFSSWSVPEPSQITQSQVTPLFKQLAHNMFEVITGEVGRRIGGNTISGQIFSNIVPYVGRLLA